VCLYQGVMIWNRNLLREFGWRFLSQSLKIFCLDHCTVHRLARSLYLLVLVGDLNANFLPGQCTDRISREVKDLLKGIGMSQLIKEPTRITEHRSSLIDLILSTHPHNIPVANVIPLGLSDHYMVGCVRKMNSLKFQVRTNKCRNYAKYN